MADQGPADVDAMLDALRERGAQRIDPVRLRLIESLLRRAQAHQGAVRQGIDDKVAALLTAMDEALTRHEATLAEAPAKVAAPDAKQSLASLVAHIAAQKPGSENVIAPGCQTTHTAPTKAKPDSPVDSTTLQFFRRTWSRLSADQRLAQSRSSLPDNAGPLNSQHLVHRSLNVMRELSPEYFDLFISHVDTLLWLERASEQAAREVGLPPRAKGGKKAAGTKRG